MDSHLPGVGIDRRVQLEWLEQTANLVLAGNDRAAVWAFLHDLLQDKLSIGGHAPRGSREKLMSILVKIWVDPPERLKEVQMDGLNLLASLPAEQHIALHWTMTMAVYPFWGAVASTVGRLLRLQGSATTGQVQRRLVEQYGDRMTVRAATMRVMRSYTDWGVLAKTGTPGVYQRGRILGIDDPALLRWLIQAFLWARPSGTATVTDILVSPALFPFRLDASSMGRALVGLLNNRNVEIVPLGLNDQLLALRGRDKRRCPCSGLARLPDPGPHTGASFGKSS